MILFYKENNTSYNDIIPLGEECYTCMCIDKKFNGNNEYRHQSYPFDYVGHTFVKNIYDKLSTNTIVSNIIIKQFGEKYFYYDEEYGFCYWHDTYYTKKNDFLEQDYNNFSNKYNKRYERLYKKINSNEKIIYLSIQHFDKIFNNNYNNFEDVYKLYKYLNKNNENILFLCINYTNKDIIENNFNHFFINYDKNVNNFNESKKNFETELHKKINALLTIV